MYETESGDVIDADEDVVATVESVSGFAGVCRFSEVVDKVGDLWLSD